MVWRGERQHYMRQNVNQPFDAFTVPVAIADPGPDGRVGTADDGAAIPGYDLRPDSSGLPPVNIVRNVPGADSHYWTWEITATRRFTGRWSLVAGFAHTWSRDQASGYFGQSVRNNVYPLTPNDLINAGQDGRYEFGSGPPRFTARTRAVGRTDHAVSASSVRAALRSHVLDRPELRHNVRILAEPIGTRRMDNITLLDVRVEKGFRLGGHRRVAGFVDVFNVLNANPEQNTSWSSGPSFLRPLSIVPPRLARLGVKLEW